MNTSRTTGFVSIISLYYLGDGDANKPDDFVDSVDDVMAEGTQKVVDTLCIRLTGVRVSARDGGIYIREDRMEDGTKRTVKNYGQIGFHDARQVINGRAVFVKRPPFYLVSLSTSKHVFPRDF